MAFGLNFQTDSDSDSVSVHDIYQNDSNSINTPAIPKSIGSPAIPKKENLKLTDRTERNKTIIQSEQHQKEQFLSKKEKSKTLKNFKSLNPDVQKTELEHHSTDQNLIIETTNK